MYNYNIKYNVEFFYLIVKKLSLTFCERNVWKISTSFGMLAYHVKILACLMPHWNVKIKFWHAFSTLTRRHVGT